MACEISSLTCARVTRYAKLLFNHLLELKGLEAAFDRLAPVLQLLGRTEGSFFVDIF
jgi:hypothetical protein